MTIVLLLDFLNMTNVLPPWSQPRLFIWICLTLLPLFLILLKLSSAAFFQDAEILLGGAPAIASFQHSSSSTTNHSTARIAVTRSRRSDSIIPTKSPIGDAQDSSGVLGYVADPTALQRGRQAYLQSQNSNNNKDYWKAIQEYQSQWRVGVLYYGDTILSTEHICAFGPGRGIEEDYGYKLLKEKILIANEDAPTSSSPRLFCGIYTWSGMRDLTRTQALTWGYKCDGFLAFSNETIPDLGMVHLVHRGEESYQNMVSAG